ncbi:hypothetical protein [Cryptosporangium phraense]|uniref:Uncharacterized protein n=1 Tax=Cryptosporangium phraense TaxID=2593070 RepID=A0A545AYK6_9ACTN|nr:hypothetical protein [Cryptosporangium phraense]TQS46427.1 hypothetical protein FL583_03275 [Cryptosporangium phraense]
MKRHPVDSVSLVFALLFTAAVAWWGVAMISSDPLHVPAAWIGASLLLIIGLVGLISALRPQRQQVESPLTVPPAPQPALHEPDPYNDPFLASMQLPRVDGVLDADAIAAAYREAGFEDPAHAGPASPTGTAVLDRPSESTPDEEKADAEASAIESGDDEAATADLPVHEPTDGNTKRLPADRDGGAAS